MYWVLARALPWLQVASFRVKKYSKFREFREQIATEWGIPPEKQFWWGWERRTNGTYRPVVPFSEHEDEMRVCDIKEKSAQLSRPWPPRLNLYLLVGLFGSVLSDVTNPWRVCPGAQR